MVPRSFALLAALALAACGTPLGGDDAGARDSGGGGQGGGGGTGGAGGAGGGTGGGSASPLPLGAQCPDDARCASGLCRKVQTLTPTPASVRECVAGCSSQGDCQDAGTFCMPVAGGALPGVCVPPYPLICSGCFLDSDCGALSELCVAAPGDSAACTVECSLAGAAACPAGYSCVGVTLDGGTRQVCRPTAGTCLDASGGGCGAGAPPLSCSRSGDAGTCFGTRVCDAGMYGPCDAPPPDCLATCTTLPPSGCTLDRCPTAATTPSDCGACGNSCPGVGQATANVTCTAPTCGFSCKGEQYDVDSDAGDGCEVADSPTGNHAQSSAVGLGSFSCNDGSSAQNFSGKLPSDERGHASPAVSGFDVASGAAPDWYSINATGGLTCQDDLNLTLTMSTSTFGTCYRLTAITNVATYTCNTTGGTCSISNGSGSYGDGTTILISVSKTCGAAQHEGATYTVTGHL